MAKQIISKRCCTCKKIKPISEFPKNRTRKDGHQSYCKICYLKYQQKYRMTKHGKTSIYKAIHRYKKSKKGKALYHKFRLRNPEQIKARRTITSAIRAGQLSKPDSLPCNYCPAQAKEYHHHKGYEPEHWFNVVPVCIKCHNKISKNN